MRFQRIFDTRTVFGFSANSTTKKIITTFIATALTIAVLFAVVSPGSRPAGWKRIARGMTKTELYRMIGPPTEVDSEAHWEMWSESQCNGWWSLHLRFDGNSRITVGDYTFRNAFFDASWNPLPKPYTLANFTTTSILESP